MKKYECLLSIAIIEYLKDYGSGFTQKEIAKKAKVSESFINKILDKKRKFKTKHIKRLAKAFQIPFAIMIMNCSPTKDLPEDIRSIFEKMDKRLRKYYE